MSNEEIPSEVRERMRSQITRRDFLKVSGAGVVGASLLGFTGCGVFGGGEQGGGTGGGTGGGGGGSNTLNLNLGADVPDMDPSTSTDAVASDLNNNILEGLYRLDKELEPIPAQAKSHEISEDGLTYTFTLRDGIVWSDGEPVTPQDFKYAWLRAMDPEVASQYAFILGDYIEGGSEYVAGEGSREDVAIETPDEKTVRVTLSRPTPYFLSLTAFKTYLPLRQDFIEQFAGQEATGQETTAQQGGQQGGAFATSADTILYNGPYVLTEFSSNAGATMEKFGDYWNAGEVEIDRIQWKIVKDENTALQLYESGELDLTGLTAENVGEYRDSPEFSTFTQFVSWWFDFNRDNEVMSNANMRRAIQRGVDRQALADQVLNNGSVAATGMVPVEMAGPGDQTFREFAGNVAPEFNPEEARQLYQQAVEELGQEPTVELLTGDTSVARDLATFIQSQFQENVGLQMNINQQPFDSRLELTNAGDYQFTLYGWIADYNDPSSFLDLYLSDNSFNTGGFSSERYDELVQGTRQTQDNQQRMEMFAEAEELLINEESGLGPVYFGGAARLTKPYVKNSEPRPRGGNDSFRWEIQREG